jgi:hypothetical protein
MKAPRKQFPVYFNAVPAHLECAEEWIWLLDKNFFPLWFNKQRETNFRKWRERGPETPLPGKRREAKERGEFQECLEYFSYTFVQLEFVMVFHYCTLFYDLECMGKG